MSPWLAAFFAAAVAMRVASLAVSRAHERRLVAAGAVEHGARVSRALAVLHAAFYASALAEGIARGAAPGLRASLGMALYLGAMLALAAVVRELGELWTVKLYLAPGHVLRRGGLFRAVRHPNYVLNLVPELVGLGVALAAWGTLVLLLPPYLLVLRARISREDAVMRERFAEY